MLHKQRLYIQDKNVKRNGGGFLSDAPSGIDATITPTADATINTESPAWAVDRLSILALKIYHMKEQVDRADATPEHRQLCQNKLNVLLEQKKDLSTAIDQLIADIEAGRKYMKVYKQMKMYNDPSTNPVLYGKK